MKLKAVMHLSGHIRISSWNCRKLEIGRMDLRAGLPTDAISSSTILCVWSIGCLFVHMMKLKSMYTQAIWVLVHNSHIVNFSKLCIFLILTSVYSFSKQETCKEELTYIPGPLDAIFLNVFRSKMVEVSNITM